MADKAELLTPVMRLRRRRRAAKAFGALLIIGLVLLVGIVLAVNDGHNYRRLVMWLGVEGYVVRPVAASPPTALRSHRTTLVIEAPSRLTRPATGMYDRFQLVPRLTAYERCERLGQDGPAPSFQASGREWECLFSQELGATPEPSVLFIQVKGISSGTFRTFRLKLSLLDPRQDKEMFRLVVGSIEHFELELTLESRRYLYDRIKTGNAFSSRLDGYRISYEQERDDDRRFNLLITQLPQTSTCGRPTVQLRGIPMHSSIEPFALECLPLQQSRSLRAIQPD